jgi:hypothetical protein
MKITAQRRLALLAGLLLLASIVFATGIQAAQAKTDATGAGGSGTASLTTPIQMQGPTAADQRAHDQGVVVSVPAVTAPAGTQGRGGFDAAHFTPPQPQGLTAAQLHHQGGGLQPVSSGVAAQPASSGTSSTSAWIAAGSAAAALIVVIAAWVLVRRRRQPGRRPSAAYCAQHPEDALCTTT